MEARVETGGDDRSMLDIEIDRLIGLLAADEKQAIVSSAMIILVNLEPAAFARLTAAMWTTEYDRPPHPGDRGPGPGLQVPL
jgi:hypothetical protein